MIKVPVYNGTIPHMIQVKYKASIVLMKPASVGTGIIAGGAVRLIMELAGIHNILSKSLGSTNKINTAKATYEALTKLRVRSDMETDKQKAIKEESGEDRAAPEVKKMSKTEAKIMSNADKRLIKPATKKEPTTKKPE